MGKLSYLNSRLTTSEMGISPTQDQIIIKLSSTKIMLSLLMSSKREENSDIPKLKAHNVYNFSRRSRNRWQSYCKGEITLAEFDATVQG